MSAKSFETLKLYLLQILSLFYFFAFSLKYDKIAKNIIRDHLRSLEMLPFDRSYMTSY